MTRLLDGVIFAAGWSEHEIKRGKNPRPVMRRKRANDTWEYLEIDEYERRHPRQQSDAERMIADQGFDLSDTASRAILHDALIDANRPDEAARLAGPQGVSAVFLDNLVVMAHEVPFEQMNGVVQREMLDAESRIAGGKKNFQLAPLDDPDVPRGTVRLVVHGADAVDSHLPIDSVVAGLRQLRADHPPAWGREPYGVFMMMRNQTWDRTGVPESLVATMGPSFLHAHVHQSSRIQQVEGSDGNIYDFRSMPNQFGEQIYYGIVTQKSDKGDFVSRVALDFRHLFTNYDALVHSMRRHAEGLPGGGIHAAT